MMAIAIAPKRGFIEGDHRIVICDITLDNNYTTGGYSLTATQLGCDVLLDAVHATATSGNTFAYDYANSKLMAFSAGAQVAGGVDLSAVTVRVRAEGKGSGIYP